jgi:hypothetical protein
MSGSCGSCQRRYASFSFPAQMMDDIPPGGYGLWSTSHDVDLSTK